MVTETKPRIVEGDEPDVKELACRYEKTLVDLGEWVEQQQENYDARFCYWPGQQKDQRKLGTKNRPAIPWNGASDLRTYVIDEIIGTDTDLLCNAVSRSQVTAVPVGMDDHGKARAVSMFMKWLVKSQMPEFESEVELAANRLLQDGIVAIGCYWEQKTVQTKREITIEEIPPEIAEFVQDPEMTGEITDMMQRVSPDLTRRQARKMVTELRNTGRTSIPQPTVISSRPVIRAHDLVEELIIPIYTTDIQLAPHVFKNEWLTKEELESKVIDEGWDEDAVETIIKTAKTGHSRSHALYNRRDHSAHEWRRGYGVDTVDELFHVVCGYYRETDTNNLPTIYYTIFCPDVTTDANNNKVVLYHDILPLNPVRYPFEIITRERTSRQLLSSRGIPEVAFAWQREMKFQRDSRIDRTTLTTVPPRRHPVGRPVPEWGPGADIPVRRADEYGYIEMVSPIDPGSIEVEASLDKTMRRYFGHSYGPDTDGQELRVKQQARVNRFLRGVRGVLQQIWFLYQQYGPEEEYFRVLGSPDPQKFTKDEASGKYDFWIEFDVSSNDTEAEREKLKIIGETLQVHDRTGRSNWDAFLEMSLEALDPTAVDRLLLPKQAATEKEAKEFSEDMTKIWAGMDIDVRPPVNAEFRLQLLQQYLQGSETIPATDVQNRYNTDEAFRSRIDKYQQQLQFIIQQRQNAETGRLGAPPGNMR